MYHAEGQLSVERPKGDPLRFTVDRCFSGESFQYFGAELYQDPKDNSERDPTRYSKLKRIRVVDDAVQGYQVVLLNLLDEPSRLVLNQATCTAFAAKVGLGRRVGDWSVVGEVRLDCSVSGLHITGNMKFDSCFPWVGRAE